jgi:polyphosphate kinase 2 (PPK2 family)
LERLLADEGTTIVKVFLHLSRNEQRERLRDRFANP